MPTPGEFADNALCLQSDFSIPVAPKLREGGSVFQHFSFSRRDSTIRRHYAMLHSLFLWIETLMRRGQIHTKRQAAFRARSTKRV